MTREQKDKFKKILLTVIPHGRENRIVVNEVAERAGIVDTDWHKTAPSVRGLVKELRHEGHPICTNNSGYWITNKVEDLAETATIMIKKGTETINTANAVLKARLES